MYKAANQEIPETYTYQYHIQNHIQGFHVQYNEKISPLQYLITSYDTGNKTTYTIKVDRSHNIQ